MNKKKQRQLNKMKKQIGELFLMGEVTEDEATKLQEEAKEATKLQDEVKENDKKECQDATAGPSRDASMMVSRKLAAVRQQKQAGPQLTLTLERLGGVYMSHPEVRDLVQFSVIGPVVAKPKWAHFRPWKSTSQTVLIRVNCTSDYIENNEYSFTFVDDFFSKKWIRMDSNVADRNAFWKHMVEVPVSLQEQIREKVLKMEPITGATGKSDSLKMELLVTSVDMVDHSYPFPLPDNEIMATKDRYAEVSSRSPLFALDCEMCVTTAGMHELTRISLIREDGSVVFDTLVKPLNAITDYLTKFSGITPQMLENVTTTLSDVQQVIRAILPPDAILCGHSLEFDLRAMRMAHPYCIDVGLIFNLSGTTKSKTSLKNLMHLFLGEDIQGSRGHCSVEDSFAALKLVQLKFENGLVFGNCRYGWSYDDWFKKRKAEKMDEEDEKREREEEEGEETVPTKKRKMEEEGMDGESAATLCACGSRIGMDCILVGCQCQKAPPTQCIKCLTKLETTVAEGTFNWSEALRTDTCTKTRPMSYYLVDSRKTVMCGFDAVEGVEVPKNRIFTPRSPTSHASLDDYVEEVSCDLLDYGLAMVELDYMNREMEISSSSSQSPASSEDGERPPSVLPQVVQEMDGHIEKIIRSAAKYSLVVLVFASPTASVCYLKVKQ